MELWQIWIVAGVLLWIVEIFTPAFVAGALGTACFITAPVAGADFSFSNQLLIYAIATLLIFLSTRSWVKKRRNRSAGMESNIDALIGMQGIVTQDIDSASGVGRVKLGGEDWSASTVDGSRLAVQSKVVVCRIEGNRVFVEPV